jgi:Uma2 family endonuclease
VSSAYLFCGIDHTPRRRQHHIVIAKVPLSRRRFTVEEYRRMAHVGILTEADRVELIDGEIIQATSIGRRHAGCVTQVTRHLTEALGDRALVWPRNPIRLPRDTEPQPDVTILRPPADDYIRHLPTAAHVLWLVEIADVSYRYDRYVKLPLYARAGIPEAWIIDLTHDVVEVHRDPISRGYGSTQTVDRGGTLRPLAVADVVIPTADILPQA